MSFFHHATFLFRFIFISVFRRCSHFVAVIQDHGFFRAGLFSFFLAGGFRIAVIVAPAVKNDSGGHGVRRGGGIRFSSFAAASFRFVVIVFGFNRNFCFFNRGHCCRKRQPPFGVRHIGFVWLLLPTLRLT